ncbi:SPFH/Band 7/PHB domain protein [Gammaproteobacteria bacterium]|nr:SPFH/Band 7/PHB domain protein [Gammaproteobacteria bacterium]
MVGSQILILAIVTLSVILILKGVKKVPQGSEWTVERFGRYTHTLRPGLSLIIPFVDEIGSKLSLMEQVLDIPSQEIISSDNAMVKVDAVVFYQVVDTAKASYEVRFLENAMRNLIMTNIRTVLGSLDLDSMLSQRDKINNRLLCVVDEATTPWGVKVTRVEIKEIAPPKNLVESMARQMKAERDKRATILEAEGQRQSSILHAEGEKKALILEAEGKKESAYRESEARERLAQAEAKATEMVSQAVSSGSSQALNYFVAQGYVEALGKIASADNQKVIFLPLEATSVLGSIAGIGELAKAAFPKENK